MAGKAIPMRRCKFLVEYYDGSGKCPARFWDFNDAVAFAVIKAARYSVEIIGPTGIQGQWWDGKVTPEFCGRDLPDANGMIFQGQHDQPSRHAEPV